jgi:hypothetical protein
MLRLAVLILLLANAAYFAWSQSLLAPWGIAPAQQTEPQRMGQQIRPQLLRILSPDEARPMELTAAGLRSADCLQAGPLDDGQSASLKRALVPWPAGSWSLESAVEPARWIVYMGKYASAENAARKKAELRQLGVSFEALVDPALEPGLSLGGYASEAEAARQIDVLAQRGVRTARVVQERAEVRGLMLKLPALDETLRARLDELKAGLGGKSLHACR